MDDLKEFVTKLAAAEPLPGGGSAAALTGALAAALGEMMAGLTAGREKFAQVRLQIAEIHARMSALRTILQGLVLEDQAAYQALLQSLRLPKETAGQITSRGAAIEEAARLATESPLRTARASVEVLENLKVLIEIGNPNAKSDAAVGAQLAYASLKSGQYNVLANIGVLKDRSYAENCRLEISALVLRGQLLLQHIDGRMTGA